MKCFCDITETIKLCEWSRTVYLNIIIVVCFSPITWSPITSCLVTRINCRKSMCVFFSQFPFPSLSELVDGGYYCWPISLTHSAPPFLTLVSLQACDWGTQRQRSSRHQQRQQPSCLHRGVFAYSCPFSASKHHPDKPQGWDTAYQPGGDEGDHFNRFMSMNVNQFLQFMINAWSWEIVLFCK